MADDFAIRGADEFLRLSKALKNTGRTELRKELHTGLRRGAKPLIAKTRSEALKRLPKRGGLARKVAREPQRIQVRTGLNTAGVRVVVSRRAGGGAQAANRGFIRHPVFGNRDVWVTQSVPPGWFDDPIKASAPDIRRELETVLNDIAERVVRETRR